MIKEMLWGLMTAFLLCETTLLLLNHCSIQRNLNNNIFKDFIDDATFGNATAYSLARNHFALLCLFYKVIIWALILRFDLIPMFIAFVGNSDSLWVQSTWLFLWNFFLSLFFLPLGYLSTFKIEKDFGFNRSTRGLWIVDQIKGFCVGACLNIPLFTLLLYLLKKFSNTWWIWGALGCCLLQVILIWLYPKLILPLFNKLTPLEEGTLKTRLEALAQKVGFKSAAIQVLDSSKRSTHSNAYCSSIGKIQHIVLFDTLLKNFTDEEIEAILAHEIGHYKRKHIQKILTIFSISTLLGLKFCDVLLQTDWLAEQFGLTTTTPLLLLILLSTFLSLFLYWFKPITNYFSRKYEYEADAFANALTPDCGENLIHALKKLYRENLSNLFPNPLYSRFHYSHPTLTERESAIHGKNSVSKNH